MPGEHEPRLSTSENPWTNHPTSATSHSTHQLDNLAPWPESSSDHESQNSRSPILQTSRQPLPSLSRLDGTPYRSRASPTKQTRSRWQPITMNDGASSPPAGHEMPAYFDDPYAARMDEAQTRGRNRTPRTPRGSTPGTGIPIPPPISASIMIPNLMQSFRAVAQRVERARQPVQRESRLWREYISTLSQEKALQGEIQELLDSQAAALARTKAGWGNNGEGSSASSSLSGREGRPMTLRKSRIGLLKALNDCSALVAQRTELLSSGCALLREEFRKLDGWQRKVVDIEGQAKREEIAIGNSLHGDRGDDDQKIRQFEDEIKTHEREIANLKIKVAEKRSQLRELRLKDEEKRSQMEAELARFKHARRDIELEAQRWLAHPPDDIFIPSEILESEVEPVIARIINPHPSPRSLEDTHYNLSAVLPLIEHKVEEAEVELEACEAGNDLWEEALEAILTFEGEMARWIKRRGNGVPKSELLKRMEAVGDHLQEALRLAESEGWPLLICILAAEVESWMEGEVVLQEMLGVKGLMRADRKGKGTGKNRDAVMSSMDDDEPTKEPMRPDDFLKEPLQPSGRGRGHSTASTATSEGIWGHNYEPPGLQTRTSSHALDLAEVGYDRPESNSATNLTNASPSCKPGSAVISSDDNSRSQDLKTTTRTSRPEPSFRTALEYSRSHSRPHSRSSIRSQHSDASHHSIEMEGLKISDEASSTPRKAASRFSSPRLGSPMVGVGSGEFGGRTGLGRTERRRTDGAGDGNAGESDGGEPPADLLG